jgi:hypothetical protein
MRSDTAEPVFVNLERSPGIDSQPGGPVRQAYLSYRPARLHRQAESIPELLKRLQLWAPAANLQNHRGMGYRTH